MLRSTFFVASLLQGLALGELINPIALPQTTLAARDVTPRGIFTCNYDNCLRVLTNTPSVASTFCSTFIETTITTTVTPVVTISGDGSSYTTITPASTNYPTIPTQVIPTHVASQCQLGTATATPLSVRLSSGCTCLSIAPSTVTTTVVAPASTTIVEPTGPCSSLPNPYTVANGDSYTENCSQYFYGDYGNNLQTFYQYPAVPSFALCLETCSTYSGCVAIDWLDPVIFRLEGAGCYLLSSIDEGTNSYPGFESALLVGYTGP